jgi:hypothetical protein
VMAEATSMVAAVMTMAEKVVADITDRKMAYQRECWFVSSISEVRIMCNITP